MKVFKISKDKNDIIKDLLKSCDFRFSELQYADFQAKIKTCTITLYNSGKIVIAGKEEDIYANILIEKGLIDIPKAPANCWFGVDEAGKGDLFGPLVVVSVLLSKELLPAAVDMGIKDSKSLKDDVISRVAYEIRKSFPFKTIVIMPEKYNILYEKFGNLNTMLAWAHSKAAQEISNMGEPELGIFDKFAHENVLDKALFGKVKARIIQRTKAENDIAVAAASIVARDEFIRRISQLSEQFNIDIPKGCSKTTMAFARELKKQKGPDIISKLCKEHFKFE